MSEAPYGLKRQPFKTAASGADVFVGPQTAKVMQSTKKALGSPDAVVAVIGPAGTGKTTLVKRALGTISGEKQVIHVARMQLRHDEILELLLEAVGATDIPASTLKQFRLFQRLCVAKADAGVRTIILVEDAVRIGEDALAELEALTASDGLDNSGANLVLLGDPSLGKLLHTQSLERLRQRLRLYQKVQPLAPAEMQGYLKHCFRMAGGEFDLLFDEEAATFFHSLSAGIPRIVNNLVDSVLAAGAEDGLARIDLETIRRIAEDQYGLTADLPEATQKAATAAPKAEASPRPAADRQSPTPARSEPTNASQRPAAQKPREAESRDAPAPGSASTPTTSPATAGAAASGASPARGATSSPAEAERAQPSPKPDPKAKPAAAEKAAAQPTSQSHAVDAPGEPPASAAPASGNEGKELELVQDTLPDLAILAPDMAGPENGQAPGDGEDIPTLFSSQTVDTGKAAPGKAERAENEIPSRQRAKPPGQASAPKAGPAQAAKPASPASAQPEQAPESKAAATKPAATAKPQPGPRKPATAPTAAQAKSKAEAAAPQPRAKGQGKNAAKTATPPVNGQSAAKKAADEPAPAKAKAERRPAAKDQSDDKPAWERDPTLAELRPDFAALEQAMAEFAEPDADAPATASPAAGKATDSAEVELRDATVPALPEITLDSAIEDRIAEETAARDRKDGPRPGDDVPIEAAVEKPAAAPDAAAASRKPATPAPQPQQPAATESTRADDELERIAAGLARARTIEDVDDKMAETLFGEEFSAIAAQIAANPPPEYLEAMAESSSPADDQPAPGAAPASDPKPAAAAPKSDLERQFMEVYGEDAVNVDIDADQRHAGLDLSASQRLATVRALNTDGSRDTGNVQPARNDAPPPPGPPPAPIEDQITTSMTQTMRTLQATPPPANDDDDDDEDDEKKGGFFRRFRRS